MADDRSIDSSLCEIADRKIVDLHDFKRIQRVLIADIVKQVLETLAEEDPAPPDAPDTRPQLVWSREDVSKNKNETRKDRDD